MPKYLLPYYVPNEGFKRRFVTQVAANITLAADQACRELRAAMVVKYGHEVMCAVAEVDFMGQYMRGQPRNNPAPAARPNVGWGVRRRKRT
jgi:predicted fused transcriptional regulator/phosphomethylpyrimidine kinase